MTLSFKVLSRCSIVIPLIGLTNCAAINSNGSQIYRVCELVKSRTDRVGDVVTIRGILFTDWRGSTGLIDEGCPDFIYPLAGKNPSSADQIWRTMLEKTGKKETALRVTVTGEVVFDKILQNVVLAPTNFDDPEIIDTPPSLSWFAGLW